MLPVTDKKKKSTSTFLHGFLSVWIYPKSSFAVQGGTDPFLSVINHWDSVVNQIHHRWCWGFVFALVFPLVDPKSLELTH